MKLTIFLSMICLFLISCKENDSKHVIVNESGTLVKKTFHDNGKLRILSKLNSDSVRHGLSMYFYPDGDTARIVRYVQGQKDSIDTEIYESGNLKKMRVWRKDLPWGEFIEYYDGLTETYYTLIDNDTFEVEEPLKKNYSVFNHKGEVRYQRQYDKTGSVLSESGNGILFNKLESFDIIENDTLKIQYYLATPDWVSREFNVNKYNEDGELLESSREEIDESSNAVFYRTSFQEAGLYRIEGILKLIDELHDRVKLDTLSTEIMVKMIPET